MAHTFLDDERTGSRHTWWLGAALIGMTALLAWQFTAPRDTNPAPNQANVEAVSQHCEQFVAIAKANFGPNWKPRLDPRDPLCATEIQQAWERQRIPRPPVAEPAPPQVVTIVDPVAPPNPVDAAPPSEARAESEATAKRDVFCLNVLGLARTKYGDDWPNYITAQEAEECQSYADKMR
jgi:hypothetical protein